MYSSNSCRSECSSRPECRPNEPLQAGFRSQLPHCGRRLRRHRESRHGPRPRRRAPRSGLLAHKLVAAVRCRGHSHTRCRPGCRPRCRPRARHRGSQRTQRCRAARPDGVRPVPLLGTTAVSSRGRPVPLLGTTAVSSRGETSRGHSTNERWRPSGPSCPRAAASRRRGYRPRRRSRAGSRPRPLARPSLASFSRPIQTRLARAPWTVAHPGGLGSRAE